MNPPLAKKDYVHLTDQGADTLARLMISDLFTVKEPDPFIIIPPDVQIDTAALAKAEDASVIGNEERKRGLSADSVFSYLQL